MSCGYTNCNVRRRPYCAKHTRQMKRDAEQVAEYAALRQARLKREAALKATFDAREAVAGPKRTAPIRMTQVRFLEQVGVYKQESKEEKTASEAVDDFLGAVPPYLTLGNVLCQSTMFMFPIFYCGNTVADLIHEFRARGFRASDRETCVMVEIAQTTLDLEVICRRR